MSHKQQLASLTSEAVLSNHSLAEEVPDACIASLLRVLHNNVNLLNAIYDSVMAGDTGDDVRGAITAILASHQVAIDTLEERQRKVRIASNASR